MPLDPIPLPNGGFAFANDKTFFTLEPSKNTGDYERVTFSFLSNGKRLEHAMSRVEIFIRTLLGEGSYVDMFVIAASELLSNPVKHAKKNHRVTVSILSIPDQVLLVSVMDKAGPLDIRKINTSPILPDGTLNLGDTGRGFFIMIQGSDVVGYCPLVGSKLKEIFLGLNLERRKAMHAQAAPTP